ncbi:MAG: site-specific integrase [Planctomycetota bacterium]|nr:site-specific integrase [Planctomycetota bacterium]
MPRLTTSVPKYRKHHTGQAFVRLSGRYVYLGKFGSHESKEAYNRVISEWTANHRNPIQRPVLHDHAGYTVAELALAYYQHAQVAYPKLQPRVVIAIRILTESYGEADVAAFGALALQACRKVLIDQHKSRTYCNDITAQIQRIFQWGASQELVPVRVHHLLRTVKALSKGRSEARETDGVKLVDGEVVANTLPCCPHIVADMVRFQLLTGCRPQDVCNLRAKDIDRSGDVWVYSPTQHKNEWRGKDRIIAVGPQAQTILKPYLRRDAAAYCFSPKESLELHRRCLRKARKTPVQPSQQMRTRKLNPAVAPGDRYTPTSYRKAVQRAAENAGVEKWAPNQLRHSVGTKVRKHFGLEAAQVVLGHARADATQIYAAKNLELAREVARRIG